MKKILFAVAVLIIASGAHAQSERYVSAMQDKIAQLDTSKTLADLLKVSDAFARIGDAEKTQWLPYYYAGLALSTMGWRDSTSAIDKDDNATAIKSYCDKAEANTTSPADQAEIYVLRNMAATQQMMVDPQSRYMTYGQEAAADLEKAIQLDPSNPRIYYLQGMSLFKTPEQYGGGKDKAKPLFEKSVLLFTRFAVKPLYPKWGQKQATEMLAQCQ
jgi:hypothetical protein